MNEVRFIGQLFDLLTHMSLSDFVLLQTSYFTIWCPIFVNLLTFERIGRHMWMLPCGNVDIFSVIFWIAPNLE